jgi:Ca2+-binding RTX toxin-like protein
MWFGKGNDLITVKSVPTLGSTASRTTTSLHAGKGNDIITIELKEGDNVGALFIANGQDGDDSLDGTASTMPLILFGDGGDDAIKGGTKENVMIGDFGRVTWVDNSGSIVASQGGGRHSMKPRGFILYCTPFSHGIYLFFCLLLLLALGGYGDLIDTADRKVQRIESLYPSSPTNTMGSDIIIGNVARDIIFGSGGSLGKSMSGNIRIQQRHRACCF